MRFIASRHGMTNVLSTTEKFVVIDDADFGKIMAGLNMASLLISQIENPTDLDGNLLAKSVANDAVWDAQEALGRARWLQLFIS